MNDRLKHTDHFTLLLTLKKIPLRKKRTNLDVKSTVWNTKKSNGWEECEKQTEVNEKLLASVNNSQLVEPDDILNY